MKQTVKKVLDKAFLYAKSAAKYLIDFTQTTGDTAVVAAQKARNILQENQFLKRISDTLYKLFQRAFGFVFRKGEYSFFTYLKGAVALIFVFSIFGILLHKDFTSIVPLHASGEEEVKVDKTEDLANSQELLSARFVVDENGMSELDFNARGGGLEEIFSTVQGTSFSPYPTLNPADPSSEDRTAITHYVVKHGDNPGTIAQKFGLSVETILWSNNLGDASYIQPGEKLVILPVDGINYNVQSGDDLISIANAHDADIDEIVKFNGLPSADYVLIGQQLVIPGGTKPSSRTTTVARAPATQSAPTQNVSGYFAHPTNWAGRKTQGLHSYNATDWAASCGTPIYAAASGTVDVSVNYSYSAWVGGFGNYVRISHSNGTATLYAHIRPSGVMVGVGEWVNQGQLIGYMGTTGRSTGCHVHFSVYGARNPY